MPESEPADPITALQSNSAAVHELFTSYVNAGFTRPEALAIVCHLLRPFAAPPG